VLLNSIPNGCGADFRRWIMIGLKRSLSSLALWLGMMMLWIAGPLAQPYTYTFPDLYERLMVTIENGGAYLPLMNDQEFEITNASGETWSGFCLRLEGREPYGDFPFVGLADYNGAGSPVYVDDNGDLVGRTEIMRVFLLSVPDGSTYSFDVDILHLPPEGLIELDIYGDPFSIWRIIEWIDSNMWQVLALINWEATMVAGLSFELHNETDEPWSEYRLRLRGYDEERSIFPFLRFEDTDGDQDIYVGPGTPIFLNPDGQGGDDVLLIRDLEIPAGQSLEFEVDFTGYPPEGLAEVEILGRSFPEPTAVPGEEAATQALPSVHCVPNPFNPSTEIAFNLPAPAHVDLEIFDPAGRLVRRLVSRDYGAGSHSVLWDGMDDRGGTLASGAYLALFRADGFESSFTMTLLK